MSNKIALLVGATGLVGGHCLDLLLEDETYEKVIVLSRRSLQREHPKLQERTVNFDDLVREKDWTNADHIFCCLGTTIKKAGSQEAFSKVDFHYPHEIARLASQSGAEQFLLVSAMGADVNSKIFYNRVKGEVERAISELPFYGIQIFRPSLLLGNRQEFRFGEKIAKLLMPAFSFLLAGGLRKYRPIAAETVAVAMVETAKLNLKGINVFESNQIQFFYDRIMKER